MLCITSPPQNRFGTQLNEYLRFFEQRRELYASEIDALFHDVEETR
jgi:hypothetical protein